MHQGMREKIYIFLLMPILWIYTRFSCMKKRVIKRTYTPVYPLREHLKRQKMDMYHVLCPMRGGAEGG
jgi:hypothetical protein